MALPLSQARWETLALIETLEPFGVGNPRPTFCSYDVEVRHCRSVGSKGRSLKLTLSDGTAVWDAIAFRAGMEAECVPSHIDIVYTLQARLWNNERRLQLVVKDLRPAQGLGGTSTARTQRL
jgi:single-stranded-DNA-specific exonuclease